MRQLSDETPRTSDSHGEKMIDSLVTVSQLLLAMSIPGESYLITTENDLLSVESSKISQTYFDSCGTFTNSIRLNDEFIELKYRETNGSTDYLDCTVMITPSNLPYINWSQQQTITIIHCIIVIF